MKGNADADRLAGEDQDRYHEPQAEQAERRQFGGFPGRNKSLIEIGLTPVFRFQRNGLEGPYAELGLGAHLQSETTIGDKSMSTAFQFGSHLGVGYRFGVKRAFDLSYRYQHLSNAGIHKPNDGINFNQVRLQYHF